MRVAVGYYCCAACVSAHLHPPADHGACCDLSARDGCSVSHLTITICSTQHQTKRGVSCSSSCCGRPSLYAPLPPHVTYASTFPQETLRMAICHPLQTLLHPEELPPSKSPRGQPCQPATTHANQNVCPHCKHLPDASTYLPLHLQSWVSAAQLHTWRAPAG